MFVVVESGRERREKEVRVGVRKGVRKRVKESVREEVREMREEVREGERGRDSLHFSSTLDKNF